MAIKRDTAAGTSERMEIDGSHRAAPPGRRLKPTARDLPIEVQVYLRAGAQAARRRGREPETRLTRDEVRQKREALLEKPFRAIERFAADHGLAIVRREPARRMIRLAGSAAALERAFGATMHDYRDGERRFRARSGSLCVDKAVARIIESVLGFSTRPFVTPAIGALSPAAAGSGHPPKDFASFYEFPATRTRGAGQRIALIQLGGQYYPADTADAFAAMGIAAPAVVPVSIAGAVQAPDLRIDREIALDVQVAGAIAPRATLLLYFAPPGPGGLVDAIGRAIHDGTNRPTIVSISYGAIEEKWTPDVRHTLGALFADAADLGVTVIAATGDLLATGGYGEAHVAYPASDPYVLACGGTTLPAGAAREAVWNDGAGNGTGGGISAVWPVPAFQKGVALPRHATSGGKGRGVPDVAAIADGAVGYRIRCRGAWWVGNGTSAGTPLWAGLIALINAERGHDAGFVTPRLYAAPQAFNDVTVGDNRDGAIGYAAGPGWDACTGLGSPRGSAILALF